MRKIIAVLGATVILAISVTVYTALSGKTADNHEYVYSIIQEEYGIELTENDVISITYEPIYSRDFACVAAMKLSDEYALSLEEFIRADETWLPACNAEEIVDKYIEPSLSSFENLSALKDCFMADNSYIKLIVFEESLPYVQDFSVLVVNTSSTEMFYFTVK